VDGCDWQVESLDWWIAIESGPGGTGDGTAHYSVAPNAGVRSGTIRVAGKRVSITQGP
jgi:hypothetical protein